MRTLATVVMATTMMVFGSSAAFAANAVTPVKVPQEASVKAKESKAIGSKHDSAHNKTHSKTEKTTVKHDKTAK